jgi:hypothetical protein
VGNELVERWHWQNSFDDTTAVVSRSHLATTAVV